LKKRRSCILAILIFCTCYLQAVKVEKIATIPLDQSSVIIQRSSVFCVTEEEDFIFPDSKAGDIKIFNNKGKLLKVWGSRGDGPNEFRRPTYCDYQKPYFMLMDWGSRKLSVYKKENQFKFTKLSENLVLALAYDIKFITPEKILVSGYNEDSNKIGHDLYFFYPQSGKIEFLLSSYEKYGYSSQKKYENEFLKKIAPIGISGYCDYMGKYIFFAWEGSLKILKINMETKNIQSFGEMTKNYRPAIVTPRLSKLYNERADKELDAEMQKLSYVTGIFTDDDFVALTYANYEKDVEGWQTIVQFYTPDGKYLQETILPGGINSASLSDPSFCYVKETNTLYYLSRTLDAELDDIYKILKFKISL